MRHIHTYSCNVMDYAGTTEIRGQDVGKQATCACEKCICRPTLPRTHHQIDNLIRSSTHTPLKGLDPEAGIRCLEQYESG